MAHGQVGQPTQHSVDSAALLPLKLGDGGYTEAFSSNRHTEREATIWMAGASHQVEAEGVPVLVVSPIETDHQAIAEILCPPSFRTLVAVAAEAAVEVLRKTRVPVVVTECRSKDYCWKQIHDAVQLFRKRVLPRLIVMAEGADDRTWAEVVELGAFDLIGKPLNKDDLLWAVTDAWLQWRRELEIRGACGKSARSAARREAAVEAPGRSLPEQTQAYTPNSRHVHLSSR